MKKICLSMLFVAMGLASFAQTEKGTVALNGLFGVNGGGQVQSNNAFNQFSFNVGPGIGYFMKKNWEIGAGVQYGMSRIKFKPPFDNISGSSSFSRNSLLNFNVYSRYYFGNAAVKPFAVISTGYNMRRNESTINGFTSKGTSNFFNAGGGAGLMWFPSNKVGLFTQLTYDRIFGNGLDQGALNLNFGVQINIGKKK